VCAAGISVLALCAVDRLRSRDVAFAAIVGRRLRRAFEQLGPTFVKAGQLISSSPGSLPKAFVDELAHCRDHVAPAPWDSVSALIFLELGERARHLLRLEEAPIAAGSMAQVHAAVLTDGTRVVVKVQRPALHGVLAKDLAVLRLVARLAARWSRTLRAANPSALVEDFARGISEQLSFRTELANLKRMRVALAPMSVRIPRVCEALCTEHVLVMERLDGVSVSDLSSIGAFGVDRHALVTTIVESLLVPALAGSVFHGDAHAGNLLVTPTGELALLDFGLVAKLQPAVADQLGGLLSAVFNRHFEEAGLRIFSLARGECPDVAAFAIEVQSLVSGCLDRSIGELNVASTISDLLSLAARNGLNLPEDIVAFFKQLVYLDGICRGLDPGFDLLGDGGAIVDAARTRPFAACSPSPRRRRVAVPGRLTKARLADTA
jgi:ubiquinone biosynthesis protein